MIKHKLGFILGVAAFLIIHFSSPTEGMWLSAFKVVLKHSRPGVLDSLRVSHKDVGYNNLGSLLEKSREIFVDIPADFSKTGTRGIGLDKRGEGDTTLYDAAEVQVKGLRDTLALAVLMAVFWIAEVIPIPIVALFPMVFLPLLGIANVSKFSMPGYFVAFSPYMHYLVVLFIGGFTIAEAMKKWCLHERIALCCMGVIGFSPRMIILSFMVATAIISMFVSNTATAAMMMPIGLAIIIGAGEEPGKSNFGRALMLGIAYAASIGGIGTLIGTPPNLILAGFADTLLGKTITFTDWLVIGLPLVAVLLPLTWLLLLKLNSIGKLRLPGSRKIVKDKLKNLGKLKGGERNTLYIFLLVALMWVFREQWTSALGLPWVNDAVVAIIGVVLFYIVPVNLRKWEFTLDWTTNLRIPWGTLLLFGGGLALGQALAQTGAAEFLAMHLIALKAIHVIPLLLIIILMVELLTEVTSNTAATNMMMPLLAFLGLAMGRDPLIFMIGGAVAASMAFMLPVATPPNAVVYGTGCISIKDMVKNGICLEFIAAIIWTLLLYFLMPHITPLIRI